MKRPFVLLPNLFLLRYISVLCLGSVMVMKISMPDIVEIEKLMMDFDGNLSACEYTIDYSGT